MTGSPQRNGGIGAPRIQPAKHSGVSTPGVATRRLIKETAENAGVVLLDNVGRRIFIMDVANCESIHNTALEANNSVQVIKETYLDIVKREDAAKYCGIWPRH